MGPYVNRYGVVAPTFVSFGVSDAYPDIFRGFLKSSKQCAMSLTMKLTATASFRNQTVIIPL
jgi:hypothetical protein